MAQVTIAQVIMQLERIDHHRAHNMIDDAVQSRELEELANDLYRIAGRIRRGQRD